MTTKKPGSAGSPGSPILNGPYQEPTLHYATAPDGTLDYQDRRPGRRVFAPETSQRAEVSMNAHDLLESLNLLDEHEQIETKRGSEAGKSVLETVCAFANEPGLRGGWLLLGVVREELALFPAYEAEGWRSRTKWRQTWPPSVATPSTCTCGWRSAARPSMARLCWWCMCPKHPRTTNPCTSRAAACLQAHCGVLAVLTRLLRWKR